MKYLRWFLGVVIVAWAIMNLLPIFATISYKVDPASITGEHVRLVPLMAATPWLQLAFWILTVLLLLVAAWRLFRGGKAFAPYIASVVINVASWAYMKLGPVYDSVWTERELQLDYVIMAVELVVAVLIWWLEHRKTSTPVAA